MANVIRPYRDEKIVELTSAIPTDELLKTPTVSNVLVVWDEADEYGASNAVEVSWTTTVRLFPRQAEEVLDRSV
ncbi:hypothetical protein [Curtobacterium sp. VKM Ac-2887]|uniref:hypothetical protein n=1 Tax=Curtobacterium sp. VKM Ac-2887 TaxID=2783819 RepID=UPI00188C7B2D|nr:hypothetical protein [Curtobacterium sp. VKM Ac-2887]MBF4587625.1 hypothetical protein [Curtobacterium sp. VKM Ac-2887]